MGIMALNDVRLWFGVANQTFTKLDPVYQGYTVLLIFSQRTVKAYGTFILTSWFWPVIIFFITFTNLLYCFFFTFT